VTASLPPPAGSDPHGGGGDADPAAIHDLFEELAYAGEITPDGHYVDHASWPTFARVLGGSAPDDMPAYASSSKRSWMAAGSASPPLP